jgi:endogenous inhibitor of DNA gyrase (YacG/DUF329 family)
MDKASNASCEHCGKIFSKTRRDKKFCSPLCRTHDWNEKHPRINLEKEKFK